MEKFEKIIISLYGDKGTKFLLELEDICEAIRLDNNIDELTQIGEWSYHPVYKCIFDGKDAVLKIGIDYEQLSGEIEFLEAYSGSLGPKLYKTCENPAYYIMEYIEGEELSSVENEKDRCEIFSNILNTITSIKIAPKGFKSIIENKEDLEQASEYVSKVKLDKALSILLKHYNENNLCLLHADLHHYNIIGKKFIDPKGRIGSKIFELGPFVRNELKNIEHLKEKVMYLSSMTEFSENDILEISFLDFVLSTVWCEIDNLEVPSGHLEMINELWKIV